MYNNLTNLKINNKEIVSKNQVVFKRKNKVYKKDLYVIMTEVMENNITKKNNMMLNTMQMQLHLTLININYWLFYLLIETF